MKSIVRDIKSLRIQSSLSIAVESLKYLKEFAEKNGFGRSFSLKCNNLLNARPTAVTLYNCVQAVQKEKKLETIERLIKQLGESQNEVAKNALPLFKKKTTVMTHCHSTHVVASLIEAKRRGVDLRVIVTETRPKEQGIITAKELLAKNIDVIYIVDSADMVFMECSDFFLVGADALRKEGVVNKIGTYAIAIDAKEFSKPVYVATTELNYDKRKKITIEERPVTEITHMHLKGAKIFNPAFDVTPWKYITAVITEKGILEPRDVLKELKK